MTPKKDRNATVWFLIQDGQHLDAADLSDVARVAALVIIKGSAVGAGGPSVDQQIRFCLLCCHTKTM